MDSDEESQFSDFSEGDNADYVDSDEDQVEIQSEHETDNSYSGDEPEMPVLDLPPGAGPATELEEGPVLQMPPGIVQAKDGTLWDSIPTPSLRKRGAHNIVMSPGGPKGAGICPNATKADIFKLFFSAELLRDVMCRWTEVMGKDKTAEYNQNHPELPPKTWKPVDDIEMYAFIGVLLRSGLDRAFDQPIYELWSRSKEKGKPFYPAALGRKRFTDTRNYVRFDDYATRRANRDQFGRLAPIIALFKPINSAFRELFEAGERLTADEMLVPFRGKCTFRVYMKSKPAKYGIKVWAIVDNETGYILNLQVYEGKISNQREENQDPRVVWDLAEPFLDKGRGITTDNFFTTKALADRLLTRKTSIIGTVRKTRRFVPAPFKHRATINKREAGSSEYKYSGGVTMLSYIPRKRSSVILMSTEHDRPKQGLTKMNKPKPQIILDYNSSKGAVDTADWKIGRYTCQRGTRRWPLKMLYFLIDVAAINTLILWSAQHPEYEKKISSKKVKRRTFLFDLSKELALPNINRRAQDPKIQDHTRKCMEAIGIAVPGPEMPQPQRPVQFNFPNPRTCRTCKESGAARPRKTRIMCSNCGAAVCGQHKNTSIMCDKCFNAGGVVEIQPVADQPESPAGGEEQPQEPPEAEELMEEAENDPDQ